VHPAAPRPGWRNREIPLPLSLWWLPVVALAGIAAFLARPATVQSPAPAFALERPARCVAGSCRVRIRYDVRGLRPPVVLDVDWRRRPGHAFVLRRRVPCAAGRPCAALSPVYRRARSIAVAVRVVDARGPVTEDAEALTVERRIAAAPAPRRARGGARCGRTAAGEQCQPGRGRRVAGGGAKVSHRGWPAVTGILWKVLDSGDHRRVGGPRDDELLGHHGSDDVSGGGGDDIVWGDWDPVANTSAQRDVLRGGPGDDWIYPSHGTTRVDAGAGGDHVWAFYGGGTIDCGPGEDTARVRLGGAFRLRRCEHVRHFCGYGADGRGGCRKPGEPAAGRRKTN
jgi:hypothetical protein